MKTTGAIYALAAAVIAVLVVANWTLLMQPIQLNLLFVRVEAPLAVLLLLLVSIVLLLDFGVHALTEHERRRDRRELVRQLEAARLRAEQEGDARTAAMTSSIHKDLTVIRAQLERVIASQGAAVRPSSSEAVEPELVPPRTPPGRGVH